MSLRRDVDASGSADVVLDGWVRAASALGAPAGARWGVAMPDPFDYATGVAWFDASVGKFGGLHGVDVGAALRSALGAEVAFVNDADAFALGSWALAGARPSRLVGLTLGTGVGSGWVVDGHVVDPGVPAGGRIHTSSIDGQPLEDVFSRRALRAAFVAAGGPAFDVREICSLARDGDARAVGVLRPAVQGLAAVVGPLLSSFDAELLVIGGSIAGSWDVLSRWFAVPVPVVVSADASRAGFVGAAVHASRPAVPPAGDTSSPDS